MQTLWTMWLAAAVKVDYTCAWVKIRVTKLIKELNSLPYDARLGSLQLPTLKYRCLRGDIQFIIEIYKILHNIYDSAVTKWILSWSTCTRPLSKIILKISGSRLKRNWFSHQVVSPWNLLTEDTILAPSVKLLKAWLTKFWNIHEIVFNINNNSKYRSFSYKRRRRSRHRGLAGVQNIQ